MLTAVFRWLPLALITLAAFWLRTHDLARRPMHADEANQAVKLGELLDAGSYAFDPRDHHGPTLYYAAVPIAWLRGERSLATLTESTVRLVPAFFGTTAVVLLVILGSAFCREASPSSRSARNSRCWPALAAGLFFALAPPAVYYSRYFIQETLLVTFFLAAVVAAQFWWRSGLTRWAVASGTCVGLMQATKASAPLFVAAAIIALLAARPTTKTGDAATASRLCVRSSCGNPRRRAPVLILRHESRRRSRCLRPPTHRRSRASALSLARPDTRSRGGTI